jgi:NitT/TauT family transport system ATP-binding protein
MKSSPASWSELRLVNVSKEFPTRDGNQKVLENISVSVPRGEFLCILGPSGCGKTTLLNILAGFEAATRGAVCYDERPIAGPGMDRAVIFQDVSNALFPWLTAIENVEYGNRMRGYPRSERRLQATAYLRIVGLEKDAGKFPFELSGGMKQRVQIARALANEPDVLLMDEPFAALDAINKTILQEELSRIWRETKKTIVFITHDIAEALRLATRIVVMSRGPGATVLRSASIDSQRLRPGIDPVIQALQAEIEALIRKEVETGRNDKN